MTTAGREKAGSPERFGYQWAEYSELKAEYEAQFRAWTAPLLPKDWQGRDFLDVGCGMGRNSHWPMTYGAHRGVAIDLDDRSLASARQVLRQWQALDVRKMSVYEIEFDDAFDIVFSIGVIHHLAEPGRALQQMAKAAKPGGRVLIWVYGYEHNEWIVRYFDPFRRLMFARLPIGLTHGLSLIPTAALWLFLRLGLGRIEYLQRVRGYSFRRLRNIVFDQMLPRIAHYWRRDEVEALMRGAGLSDIRLVPVNGMSWAALGSKT